MTPPGSPLDTLRRQLEGRWEELERARERHTELQRRLESSQWKRELRGAPGLLRETRQREEALQEVLAAVEHRAHGEQWPDTHPGRAVLRELNAQRTTLEALANKRLGSGRRGATTWTGALETLETLVLSPIPSLPDPSELILFEGRALSGFTPGHYWVTPRRWVWQPSGGEPEELKFAPQVPQALALTRAGLGVRMEGTRWHHLLMGRVARPLVKLLERCRQLPGLRRDGTPMEDVVVSPAYGHAANFPDELSGGMAVCWPGVVAFIPTRRLTPLDRALRWVGKEVPLPTNPELLWLEALVEHLRRLPAKAFEQTVHDLVQVRGGAYWTSSEVRRGPDEEGYLRLEHGGQVLQVPPTPRLDTLRDFLQRNMLHAAFPGVQRAQGEGWAQLVFNPLTLSLGLGVVYVSILSMTLGTSHNASALFYFLGHGLLAVAFMRYAKYRGYHPLVGLALSILCTLVGPLLLLVNPRSRPRRSRRLQKREVAQVRGQG